jgi:hypothetical protein
VERRARLKDRGANVLGCLLAPVILPLLLLGAIISHPFWLIYCCWIEPRRTAKQLREAGRWISEAEALSLLGSGSGTVVVCTRGEYAPLAWWTSDRVVGPNVDLSRYQRVSEVSREEAVEVARAVKLEERLRRKYTRINAGASRLVGTSDTERFVERVEREVGADRVVRLYQRKYLLGPVHQYGKCSKCGYSLEGLENDLCPECGELNSLRGLA